MKKQTNMKRKSWHCIFAFHGIWWIEKLRSKPPILWKKNLLLFFCSKAWHQSKILLQKTLNRTIFFYEHNAESCNYLVLSVTHLMYVFNIKWYTFRIVVFMFLSLNCFYRRRRGLRSLVWWGGYWSRNWQQHV